MPIDLEDRVLGCILSGAIGDAMGGAYEGQPTPIAWSPDASWHLSDDTQLTLATCEAICAAGTVSPAAIAESFARWFRAGRLTGLGASTLKALRDLEAGAHWALSGCKGERAAGNGAAMRVAPLAFLLDPAVPEQRTVIRDVCRITHHHDEAYVGGVAVVGAVRAVVSGAWHPGVNLPRLVAESLPDTMVRERLLQAADFDMGTSVRNVAKVIGNAGFVAESVPLAIYAAQSIGTAGFQQMVQEAIEAGGDTDTIASIAGQIAGAWLGLGALDKELIERLPGREEIMETAREFAALVPAS